jgi:hypothetical protein
MAALAPIAAATGANGTGTTAAARSAGGGHQSQLSGEFQFPISAVPL